MISFRTAFLNLLLTVLLLGLGVSSSIAQLQEPEVSKPEAPKTPLSEGLSSSLNFDFFLTNFGFGIGGHYTQVIAPYTELTFRTGITGIRDVSEQKFQNIFTGRRIIPNKYKRALGFPFILGVKQRLFAEEIADNFRFFVGAGAGPAMAFTYPYIKDNNNNGFRDFYTTFVRSPQGPQATLRPRPDEKINDFFSGWKDGSTHWGLSGEIKIGVNFGKTLTSRTTVEFGYFFYYFKQGLQILEPKKPFGYEDPAFAQDGSIIQGGPKKKDGAYDDFNAAQKLFGTPQIKITFGGMW